MELVEKPVDRRREQHSNHRDERHTAEERVETGEEVQAPSIRLSPLPALR